MYGGSGRSADGKVVVFEDLWYFSVPASLQVQRKYSCLSDVPCLAGVSVVLGWVSAGVTLSLLLFVSSPASYKRSLRGTRMLWVLFGLLGTHRHASDPTPAAVAHVTVCRFYLKRPWSGLLFLLTFGCLGVGARFARGSGAFCWLTRSCCCRFCD
jgi:hypothetical protein